jgi:hypothetical protein
MPPCFLALVFVAYKHATPACLRRLVPRSTLRSQGHIFCKSTYCMLIWMKLHQESWLDSLNYMKNHGNKRARSRSYVSYRCSCGSTKGTNVSSFAQSSSHFFFPTSTTSWIAKSFFKNWLEKYICSWLQPYLWFYFSLTKTLDFFIDVLGVHCMPSTKNNARIKLSVP